MPARGSYQVTPRKEGEVAEQDQSYRSCIIALLIFFFLCLILILSTWLLGPAKGARITGSRNDSNNIEKLKQWGSKFETTMKEISTTEDPRKHNSGAATSESYTEPSPRVANDDDVVSISTDKSISSSTTMASNDTLPVAKDANILTSDNTITGTEATTQSRTPEPRGNQFPTSSNDNDVVSTTTDRFKSFTKIMTSTDTLPETTDSNPLIPDNATTSTKTTMTFETPELYGNQSPTASNVNDVVSITTDRFSSFTKIMTSTDTLPVAEDTNILISDNTITDTETTTQSKTPEPYGNQSPTSSNNNDVVSTTTDKFHSFTKTMTSTDTLPETTDSNPLIPDNTIADTETTTQSETPDPYGNQSPTASNDNDVVSITTDRFSSVTKTMTSTDTLPVAKDTNTLIPDNTITYTETTTQSETPEPYGNQSPTAFNDNDVVSITTDRFSSFTKTMTSADTLPETTDTNALIPDNALTDTEETITQSETAESYTTQSPTAYNDNNVSTTTDRFSSFTKIMTSTDTLPVAKDTNTLIPDNTTTDTETTTQSKTPELYGNQSPTASNDNNVSITTDRFSNFTKTMTSADTLPETTVTNSLISDNAITITETTMKSETPESYSDQSPTVFDDNDVVSTTTDISSNSVSTMNSTDTLLVTMTASPLMSSNFMNNNIDKDIQNEVCSTVSCKQLASKMFLYMNPSADVCVDFYEYACGGLEENSEILGKNLLNQAYQRIENEMHKGNNMESRLFFKYYNSCVEYGETIDKSKRIAMAKHALKSIGKFYTSANQHDDDPDITDLFTKLLMHHSALLFDVVPDVNEFDPDHFTLKIGPTFHKSPFLLEDPHDPCNPAKETLRSDYVDLSSVYETYIDCKRGIKPIVDSIKESITIMVSDMTMENVPQFIDGIVHDIDIELIQGFLMLYPPDNEVGEAYVSKNYSIMTVEKLETINDLINWTVLISSLTHSNVAPDMELPVYFENQLIQGMQNLKSFVNRRGLKGLNNALLGLYARNLYQELIVPKPRDPESHCLRVASNLMQYEASNLYMSSFTEEELERMNATINEIFDELKYTLKLNFEDATWLKHSSKEQLLEKLEQMTITIPNILYYKNSSSLGLSLQYDPPSLTDNYFDNSILLMKKYRSNMYYEHIYQSPRDPQKIWTYFTVPFQTRAVTIYGLNTVVVPFGVIDWTVLPKCSENLKSFDYLLFATLGNVIAREISHHFDSIGMYYYEKKRDMEYMIINEDSTSLISFNSYTSCHNTIYSDPINVTIQSSNQTVKFEISKLSLNERLSDIMGLRLAYNTLVRIDWADQMPLPWLNMTVQQLFYLAFAQTHCTKLPLTSSYIQDEHLPSRMRIFVSASSEHILGNTWSCQWGTNIVPADTCPIFPKLVNNEKSEIHTE